MNEEEIIKALKDGYNLLTRKETIEEKSFEEGYTYAVNRMFYLIKELQEENEKLKLRNQKAIKVYNETIDYITTINSEFMDRNTKLTIKEMIKNLEKELNILQGSDKE